MGNLCIKPQSEEYVRHCVERHVNECIGEIVRLELWKRGIIEIEQPDRI